MSAVKQRNAAKNAGEKISSNDTALIQDSTEQENEIKSLRKENTNSNEQAQTTLDVGVITNLLLTGLQATTSLAQPQLRNLIALAQFILLPLSITPNKIPYVKLGWAAPFYAYIFRLQVALAFTAIWVLYEHSELSIPSVFRVSLPGIVAGGVLLQRKSEKEAEERLKRLEKLRYNVKGA